MFIVGYILLAICGFSFHVLAAEALPPGVMAIVNGQPILLQQVEALNDIAGNTLMLREKPEVHFLQEQYGDSLYTLIIYTLMSQELQKIGLKVSDQDVLAAEEEIKQDYLGEDFEKSLQEEYLDLETWRQLMKQRITFQRFQKNILRPQISISSEEIEEYYQAHLTEFFIPEKVEIIWYQEVGTSDQGMICQKDSNNTDMANQGDVIRIALDRLPEKMRQDLTKVQPGEYTPRRKEGEIYQCALLRNRYPAHQADMVEAYPRIELILLEQKMEKVYENWLEKIVPQAKIQVCPQFQPAIPSNKEEPTLDVKQE